jgi:ribosomal protein L2
MESKFFKVIGDMKVYKPITPGLANRRQPTRFHLHKGSCIKRLSVGKRSTGGRNRTGKVTVRHRGGGHKKRIRLFQLPVQGEYRVERFEYDPNRNGELMLVRHLSTNEFYYLLRTSGVEIHQTIHHFPNGVPSEITISKSELIQVLQFDVRMETECPSRISRLVRPFTTFL